MVNIPTKIEQPFTKETVLSINDRRIQGALDRHSIGNLNAGSGQNRTSAPQRRNDAPIPQPWSGYAPVRPPAPQPAMKAPSEMAVPRLQNEAQKGQKVTVVPPGMRPKIRVGMGWNLRNPECDVDVSAFLLRNGKVPADAWFVFYGQTASPDASTVFSANASPDRESISIDFSRLSPSIDRIAFILTINEAMSKGLDFSMIKDAYIRITDDNTNQTLVSYKLDAYYANVISMTIGELYLYNGAWKFNAVGNGVGKDLAGMCRQYGVQVE